MLNKPLRLLGLARRSRNLVSGYNTCIHYLRKGKIKLLVIAEDASANTKDKLSQVALNKKVRYVIWGKKDELSHAIGIENRNVIGIIDENLASAIVSELEK